MRSTLFNKNGEKLLSKSSLCQLQEFHEADGVVNNTRLWSHFLNFREKKSLIACDRIRTAVGNYKSPSQSAYRRSWSITDVIWTCKKCITKTEDSDWTTWSTISTQLLPSIKSTAIVYKTLTAEIKVTRTLKCYRASPLTQHLKFKLSKAETSWLSAQSKCSH